MSAAIDWEALRAQASSRLVHAYAPYSGFSVAAALLCDDGRVFTGVNVENASYGLTVCAERNALAAAVADGARRVLALVVVCSGEHAVTPCGACRQVLAEFPPAFALRSFGASGDELHAHSDALLPAAFSASSFKR